MTGTPAPADYARTVTLAAPFDEAVARVREALAGQGFGVLTEIDVRATLREKIGAEMEPYLILGACNPPLAHRALDADRSLGLLLPCNVVVRAPADGGTLVQAVDPETMVRLSPAPGLPEVADEARRKLDAALDALR
ncbi:DUF302 domain-containing protein [Actinacidiphila rubida]|uniref:Uncharacterized conserved protein, DUF302 family n=1 Tax=Actinacidiphila rubida TaxID=310780 RepID=A0A1H8STG5_9ACTN|nr:DUF302 domain-containing protein [Actinacidiphila rubida]SEO81835.1 Uncharacterized conserved protein, DUF302 family [Actinacidiphila rubida]